MKTSMRYAFENATVVKSHSGIELAGKVIDKIEKHSGERKEGRQWEAKLAPATVKKLVKDGVFA